MASANRNFIGLHFGARGYLCGSSLKGVGKSEFGGGSRRQGRGDREGIRGFPRGAWSADDYAAMSTERGLKTFAETAKRTGSSFSRSPEKLKPSWEQAECVAATHALGRLCVRAGCQSKTCGACTTIAIPTFAIGLPGSSRRSTRRGRLRRFAG